MAVDAAQIQYRQEMIATFEVGTSALRETCTTEAMMENNSATFLVAGSGGNSATTRGTNGLIPAVSDSNTQVNIPLVEWHDLRHKTRFNIFSSQGDQRALMQRNTVKVLNRKINSDIITELNTATVTLGATAVTFSMELAVHGITALQNSDVPCDGNIFALITPAANGYLSQVPEYASADYVNVKPVVGNDMAWVDNSKMKHWMGVNWIVHPQLPGLGTASEVCFMYHRDAIGHAFDTGGLNTAIGYNDEQDYSYARASGFMGTEILQSSGVIKINHDGSGFATV